MIIEIDIAKKRPSVVGTPIIICGNSGYTIEFNFDDEWADYAVKTARFVYVQAGAVKHQDVVFSGSSVDVPVLSNIREVNVGVYAGELRTTTPARILCERSILCGGGVHEEPPEDVYLQIMELLNEKIMTTMAPEFAESEEWLEANGDTSKLYVLPDGYIYAYTQGGNVPLFTDQLKNAVDSDGTPYNGGLGYKPDTYVDSSGVESTRDGWTTTGFIPYNQQEVIRVCGATVMPDVNAGKLQFYDASFVLLGSSNISHLYEAGTVTVEESPWSGVYIQVCREDLTAEYIKNASYVRYMIAQPNEDHILCTYDEEIVYGEGTKWTNTGHAFVPADYEDRIIELEETTETLVAELAVQKEQIAHLADGEAALIPDYVVAEAESVMDRVVAVQGRGRTFTFAALTDMHYGEGGYTAGVAHACQALKYIGERIELDAVAVLGDYTDGDPDDGYAGAIADLKTVNSLLEDLRLAPNLRLAGNHDNYDENPALTTRYINAYSDDVVWGSRPDGYYYRDFGGYKIRVICLNTNIASADQYNWLVSALDLCDKDDVTDWSILVLSHHPLDWYPSDDVYRYCYILDAYKNGTSGDAGGIVYDFTGGKNAAKLIGNIHGHLHNFKVDHIHFGNVNSGEKSSVLRMATPNSSVNRENGYAGAWADDAVYSKTEDTAEDTAFCVYCIDLDACTIKAICYGAGCDREIDYSYVNDVAPPKHTDTVSWNDLTDKPFGYERTAVFENVVVSAIYPDVGRLDGGLLIVGETYLIKAYGKEVLCICEQSEDTGDHVLIPEDLEDLSVEDDTLTISIYTMGGETEVSVYHIESLKTVDEKYLPYKTEEWTFELADGSTVTKQVVLK